MTASSTTTPRPARSGEKRRRLSLSQLTALTEAGLAIVRSQLDVDALCELVYQQVTRIVAGRVQSFHLGIFEGDSLTVKVWVQDGVDIPPTSFPGAQDMGIIGWVRSTQQPLLVGDFLEEMESLAARVSY